MAKQISGSTCWAIVSRSQTIFGALFVVFGMHRMRSVSVHVTGEKDARKCCVTLYQTTHEDFPVETNYVGKPYTLNTLNLIQLGIMY